MRILRAEGTGNFWPSLAFAGLLLLALVAGGVAVVTRFNAETAERQRALVQNGFAQKIAEVQALVVPQVVWDDAVANLDRSFSPKWAQQNIGAYLYQTDGVDRIAVLRTDALPRFAAMGAGSLPSSQRIAMTRLAAPLIAQVRRDEARRGPLRRAASGAMVARPIQRSRIIRIGGGYGILTATLVQPDFGSVLPSRVAPILLSETDLDREFLDGFARRYLIEGLRIEPAARASASDAAWIPLQYGDAAPIGRIAWRPERIGTQVSHTILLPALCVVLALAGAALWLVRRNQRIMDQLVASEAHAKHLAYYDSLTGLPNRVAFQQQLTLTIAANGAASLAVLCIDLDRFKEVNDLHGHHTGDAMIRMAAQRFAELCRGRGVVARLSGDEFAIFCPNADADSGASLAHDLCATMRVPIDLENCRVYSGCSIGFTVAEGVGHDCAELLRRADLALYRAKQEGRSRFEPFDPAMDAALHARRDLEIDLREALANAALTLVYQPQVNRKGDIRGVEALMRWHHPVHGAIPPSVFIPLAEERGLMFELGMFTFRRVFTETRAWRGVRIAINISATQLRTHEFVERLAALAAEYGTDPARYELEITEGVLLEECGIILERLAALRALGFGLVLDDFGTGYSALSYLRKFPIDKIKIDRSFVASMGTDPEADEIVGAIVRLARALRLAVIAEGVETNEQRIRLAATGCWDVQGYLFGHPVPAEMLAERIGQTGRIVATQVA